MRSPRRRATCCCSITPGSPCRRRWRWRAGPDRSCARTWPGRQPTTWWRFLWRRTAGARVTILYVLIPLALVLAAIGVWAFFWAVNTGQFEDLDAASVSPLEDDLPELGSPRAVKLPAPGPSAPGGPPSGSPSSP
ncbi:MAG: cbb3-type cytochrome oxidase assembly protein CcoS [Gammaproteobacteria bacterium]